MNQRFQTTTPSRRVTMLAVPVTIVGVCLYMMDMGLASSVGPTFYLAPAAGIIAGSIALWAELRVPDHVAFGDGVMTLESILGSRTIRDGEVVSFLPSFWRTRGEGPQVFLLAFTDGKRRLYGAFDRFPQFLEELRRRNPSANIQS